MLKINVKKEKRESFISNSTERERERHAEWGETRSDFEMITRTVLEYGLPKEVVVWFIQHTFEIRN
jgi:hypothetical protein